MIAFGADVCGDWSRATSKEWLETNGLGSYASSTIVGANTRRYHGLLIAALRPPTQRTLLLSKLEDTLAVGDAEYDLSCNQYPGAIYPQGHRYLREFRLDPFPTFVYEIPAPTNLTPPPPLRARRGGDQERRGNPEEERGEVHGPTVRLEKGIAMCHGANAVIVRYRVLDAPGTVSLVIRPVVNCRDHHHLMREHASFNTRAEVMGGRDLVSMQPYPGVPPLLMHLPGAYFEQYGYWYRSFEYAQEAARGLDYREDQYSPGFFSCSLEPGESRHFVASLGEVEGFEPAAALEAEIGRRRSVTAPWERAPEELKQLVTGADQFLVSNLTPLPPLRARRGGDNGTPRDDIPRWGEVPSDSRLSTLDSSTRGIIAGYHWFEEWGRDAMIGLPGLTLVTGRFEAAKRILRAYASIRSEGLIPNRIPDIDEEPHYNASDATLWMFWAAHKYLDYTGDREFVETELLPVFLDVIEWRVRGTRYGIRVDSDALLHAGEAGTQLTWMDAKIGDWVVTPRHGKPVEINALWHHALRFVEELGAKHAGPTADAVAEAFRSRFWNEQVGYLYDVVDRDGSTDDSFRPNQVIALSLPYPLLDTDRARHVLAIVERELLTPYGLRTLSPRDARYHGRYLGDQWARDGAYHQGTVWPWLLGPFITAYMNTAADKEAARRTARGWLDPIWGHLRNAGLGQISEIFDGDEPYDPRGCIAQAWSVAEILRAAVEDLALGPPRSKEDANAQGPS